MFMKKYNDIGNIHWTFTSTIHMTSFQITCGNVYALLIANSSFAKLTHYKPVDFVLFYII